MPLHRLFSGSFRALEPRFLAEVDRRLSAAPLEPVEVLAGSNLLSVYLRRRVAEERGAAVNLRFVTFLDLARAMASGSPDPRPALPALGPRRLARRALDETSEASRFGALRDRASLCGALLSTWSDLREAGVPRPFCDVLPRAASLPDRRALLQAVGATLDRLSDLAAAFADPDALLERAAAAGKATGDAPLIVYGVWDLGGTRARLLARLAQTRPILAFVPDNKTNLAPRAAERDADLPRGPALFARLLGAAPERVADTAREAGIEAVLAPSETAEAREVVRELLRAVERGTPLHRCAVLLRHPERQEPAITAELRLRRLPYFRPAGAGFARTPAARAALALTRLAAEDAPRDAFVELADFLETLGSLPSGISAARLSATLSRAAWFGGKDALHARLARMRDGEPARDFAQRVLSALPPDAPGRWEEHASRLETLFGAFLGKAAGLLSPALDALASLEAVEPGGAIPFAEAAALLPDALDLAAVPQGRFEKDGVALLSLVSARGLLFEEVLLPGLSEGAFPAPPRPDPLLLDKEREALRKETDAPLPPRAGLRHLDGERFLFDVARESAKKRLVALAPTRDESDREKLPSPFLLALPRLEGATADELKDLKDPARARARGVRRVPLGRVPADDVALDADEALRAGIERRPSLAFTSIAPRAVAASVVRGELRRDPRFTAYEGRLGRKTSLVSLEDRVLSATLLEGLATCAYRTLLMKGLKLPEPLDELPPLVPDAVALGSLAHEVLRRITRELVDHGRSFTWNPAALEARAAELSGEAVAEWAEEAGADPPPVLLERTATHLAELVGAVLAYERGRKSRPSGAEVRFGFPKEKVSDADPDLSRVEPVAENGLLLRGQIDRIDLEVGHALVVDYKFGKPTPYLKTNKGNHLLAQGERLQIPIYALAARAMGSDSVEAAYLFVSPRDRQVVPVAFDEERTREAVARFRDVLSALADAVAAGDFLPRSVGVRYKERNCDSCPVADVCGGGHQVLYERKWELDKASTPLSRLGEIA